MPCCCGSAHIFGALLVDFFFAGPPNPKNLNIK
jgi:hypothetical protein